MPTTSRPPAAGPDRQHIDFDPTPGRVEDEVHASSLAREAKAIVALAFRNGPIENGHAGKTCPVCDGQPEYSRITDEEMKCIMKSAVDCLYRLLLLRDHDAGRYRAEIDFGSQYTATWDDPAEGELMQA
jgi:hypothetical protein